MCCRDPLSRTYGVNLPSSLRTVFSSALGYSPHLPVSVLVRLCIVVLFEVFLGNESNCSGIKSVPRGPLAAYTGGFAYQHRRRHDSHDYSASSLYHYVTPTVQTFYTQCRNINLLSIVYAFQPRLRDRLTLGGFTFPRKP